MNEITITREMFRKKASSATSDTINKLSVHSATNEEILSLIVTAALFCGDIEKALFGEEDSHD